MADFFDSIPTITVILLALGVAGVMIYERTRLRQEKKQDTWSYNFKKIQLEKIKNKYICKVSSPFIQETKFHYKITNSGIEETESI